MRGKTQPDLFSRGRVCHWWAIHTFPSDYILKESIMHPLWEELTTKVEILCQFWGGFNVLHWNDFLLFFSVSFHLRKEYKFVTLKHFVKINVVMLSKCLKILFTQRQSILKFFLEEREYIIMFLNLPLCEIAIILCNKIYKAPRMSQELCRVLEIHLDLR